MPSFVWRRDPQEAYSEPYEYPGQEQFVREASALLRSLSHHYSCKNRSFAREDSTREKAVWMLQVDSLAALEEALELTTLKKHRTASRLFRDSLETQDISVYFARAGQDSEKHLRKWFANEVIPHRIAREFVKKMHGESRFQELRELYNELSKYTHRTYRSLAMSYILSRGNRFAYDGFREGGVSMVLPHVISFSYAVLGMLIRRFVDVAVTTGELSAEKASSLWEQALEAETTPRRFGAQTFRLSSPVPLDVE